MKIEGAKVLVVGLGKSGIAATQVLLHMGALVTVQDLKEEGSIDPQLITYLKEKGAELILNKNPDEDCIFDLVVLSPGVIPNQYWILRLVENGAELIGELELAYRLGRGNYIAITGTNGKTTTTTLTGEIFKKSKRHTHVVGNIGIAVVKEAVDAGDDHWLVTEASSFQLETTKKFRPVISAVLNLTPDHLNRHVTMEAYGQAKAKIFANQCETDYLIINGDDEAVCDLAASAHCRVVKFSRIKPVELGCFLKNKIVVLKDDDGKVHEIIHVDHIRIPGAHNLENVMAAVCIAYFAGISTDIIRDTIAEFTGVPHRLEPVSIIDGVSYFNDSKGTNTDATITAMKALEKDILLIAGGDGKGQDFTSLAKEMAGRVKQLILLGRDKDKIANAASVENSIPTWMEKNMNDCVIRAAAMAEPGDKVLLSPACASWDMYDNFEQRGDDFKGCVRRLER